MPIMSREYQDIIKEHFDITDSTTRKVLINIDENDQTQVLAALTSKLYDHIINKIDDIDYGDIPNSKGDVTKIGNYEELVDSLDVMKSLLAEYGQRHNPVDIVLEALDNIRSRRDLFEKAFKLNIELPMVMYSTMVLAVIQADSYLISTCIEFIKSPNTGEYEVMVDKMGLNRTRDNLVLKNLEKFNKSCKKGEFDKSMEYIITSAAKGLVGDTAVMGLAAVTCLTLLATNIIPLLRELVFFFFYTRTKIADYFSIQAELLKVNAQSIESDPRFKAKERKEISRKQYSIANNFDKIANKVAIDTKQSENKATKDISAPTKKYKTDELLDSVPDSATSSIF